METFSPEDILVDTLSDKGSSYMNCQGFKNKTVVGFKLLRDLFSQFRELPLKNYGKPNT